MKKKEISEMRKKLSEMVFNCDRSLSSWATELGLGFHTLHRFLYEEDRITHTKTLFKVKRFLDRL